MKVAINGMGRIGRLALRAAFGGVGTGMPSLDIVHLNEIKGGPAATAHLLEFDSTHGRWRTEIAADDGGIAIAGKQLRFTEAPQPGTLNWGDLGIDIVLECSGKFVTAKSLAPYFERGAKAVIVAAPVKDGALNVVMGCNDHLYNPAEHRLLTAASCTTNCLAPIVKVIHEGIGIRHGAVTTIHDVTNTQVLVDAPHKDLRRARSALTSLIPTTTGSATAIGLIYPELQGKLNGQAIRVPLLNASLTDAVFEVARPTDVEEVNNLLRMAADGPLRGVLGFEHRPLVSVDFRSDTRSSIVDGPSTMVVDSTSVKIFAWYDNEMGYACRLVDLAAKVAGSLRQDRG
ncbi:ArsJ-associated glyceraldehyde-3-phosphate dehydrogenase [Geminicoccus roseus]|uniref:ArsJ-associated glyceraldehyde-3-phosphate dehydrogenase n=1 Tax=Geminicoccus roseus TaxID=404900 RepID=UPI000427FCBC|nr:ArsJ-associated glyceraldehyde-3-phosphate dehydrogenase [Geminicoccus roseus]